MPIINRLTIHMDNDDDQYETFINRQAQNDKKYNTARSYDLFSIGSTVAVQQEDGGPWMHATVVGSGDHSHNNRSYIIKVTKQDISSPETVNTSEQHPSQLSNTYGTNVFSIQRILRRNF